MYTYFILEISLGDDLGLLYTHLAFDLTNDQDNIPFFFQIKKRIIFSQSHLVVIVKDGSSLVYARNGGFEFVSGI